LDNWTKEDNILLRFLPILPEKNTGRKNYLLLGDIKPLPERNPVNRIGKKPIQKRKFQDPPNTITLNHSPGPLNKGIWQDGSNPDNKLFT
jgi:hypothetical protein